jgi:hypothetical protein
MVWTLREEEHDSGSTRSEEEPTQVEEKPPRRPPTSVRTHPPIVPQPHEQDNKQKPTKGGVIMTLYCVPRYDTLWIRGTIHGQWEISLIYGGATHNFLYASLVSRREL